MFYKIGVLENFAKLSEKHLLRSFFNTVAAWKSFPLKTGLQQRCFPVNFAKLLETPFYIIPPATASEM